MNTLPRNGHLMCEDHENEQYFFDRSSVEVLADRLTHLERVCCLCTPTLGRVLHERGCCPRILDLDERFSDLAGFRRLDLTRPEALNEDFDVVVCDPPFFNVSRSQLFRVIRLLCRFDTRKHELIAYLVRRERALLKTFSTFDLKPTSFEPTSFEPTYESVDRCARNRIYANFDFGLEA